MLSSIKSFKIFPHNISAQISIHSMDYGFVMLYSRSLELIIKITNKNSEHLHPITGGAFANVY